MPHALHDQIPLVERNLACIRSAIATRNRAAAHRRRRYAQIQAHRNPRTVKRAAQIGGRRRNSHRNRVFSIHGENCRQVWVFHTSLSSVLLRRNLFSTEKKKVSSRV